MEDLPSDISDRCVLHDIFTEITCLEVFRLELVQEMAGDKLGSSSRYRDPPCRSLTRPGVRFDAVAVDFLRLFSDSDLFLTPLPPRDP